MSLDLASQFRNFLHAMRQREGLTLERIATKYRQGDAAVVDLLESEPIKLMAGYDGNPPMKVIVKYVTSAIEELDQPKQIALRHALNVFPDLSTLDHHLENRRTIALRAMKTASIVEFQGKPMPTALSTYTKNVENEALDTLVSVLNTPTETHLRKTIRQPEAAIDKFCNPESRGGVSVGGLQGIALLNSRSAAELITSVEKYARAGRSLELWRLLDLVKELQFSHSLIRRNWDIQIRYDMSRLSEGIIIEELDWEYELINISDNHVDYQYKLIHAYSTDHGHVSRAYTVLPDGTREEVSFSDESGHTGHHYKEEVANITLPPHIPHYFTLFYKNIWYVNSSYPTILNATTTKQPCLNCRIRFTVPKGMRVSIINRVIIEQNMVDDIYDVRLPSPLLAEQKIEYFMEPKKNEE